MISIGIALSSNVKVDTAYGTTQMTVMMGDSSDPVPPQHLNYVRGSGSDKLVFEYVAQTDGRDAKGIRIARGRSQTEQWPDNTAARPTDVGSVLPHQVRI